MVITPLWVISIYPFITILFNINTLTFPINITEYQIWRLITTTTLLMIISLIYGIKNILESKGQNIEFKKKLKYPLIILLVISLPITSAYVFETDNNNIGQTILDIYMLFDDFNEHTPPTAPDGWTPYVGTWQTVTDGTTAYEQTNTVQDRTYSFIGDFSWTDYEFEVNAKLVSAGTEYARGILLLFRVQDASNYYFLAILDDLNQVGLYRRIGGSDILIQNLDINVPSGVWFNIRIRIEGQTINVWGNNVPLFTDIPSGGNLSNGLITLSTRFYHCRFDDVTISTV